MSISTMKQNILATAVLVCSLSSSVALGYVFSKPIEISTQSHAAGVTTERPTKPWNFNHLLALLVPELG